MCESDEDSKYLVFDIGSRSIKFDWAGQEQPRWNIPNVTGHLKPNLQNMDQSHYVGHEALSNVGNLDLKYPMTNGLVTDWEAMEKVVHHLIHNELGLDSWERSQGLILTEAVKTPEKNREKMLELWLEHNLKAIHFARAPIMTLYFTGRNTGLVLDSGEGGTQVLPSYEGVILNHAIDKTDISGRVVTDYTQMCLNDEGHHFTSSADLETVRRIKEKVCYVAQNFDQELAAATAAPTQDMSFVLPDNETIEVKGYVRIQAPELIFDPSLIGSQSKSIQDLAHTAISKCDRALKNDLRKNILLSGGNTLYEGFAARLEAEITKLSPAETQVRVIAQVKREMAVFVGASTLGSLSTFSEQLITREEYQEHGASILFKK